MGESVEFDSYKQTENVAERYEAAFRAALDDIDRTQEEACIAKEKLQTLEEKISDLSELVRRLHSFLPLDRRSIYADRLTRLLQGTQTSGRATTVFDNVVELFTRARQQEQRSNWTAAEVQAALTSKGTSTDPKAVYNVLNYLARKGRLRRVSKGQYIWVDCGLGISLGQDLPAVDQNGRGCIEE